MAKKKKEQQEKKEIVKLDTFIGQDMLQYAIDCYDKEIVVKDLTQDNIALIAYKDFVFNVSINPIDNIVTLLDDTGGLFKQLVNRHKNKAWDSIDKVLNKLLLDSWEQA